MTDDRQYWLDILTHNQGFAEPDKWVSYARSHGFKRVKATKLDSCPDCCSGTSIRVGQYVYYSTLINLRRCSGCDLIYSDTRLDPCVIQDHFEIAYKDEFYFTEQRARIFDYVARLVDTFSPPTGRVIDIGGAQGHLLAALQRRRHDLSLTLNDVSEKACADAARVYKLQTVCCSINDLILVPEQFDVALLIDVMYYEPEIRGLWNAVSQLVKDSGTLIIRVPNYLALMNRSRRILQLVANTQLRGTTTSVRLFNPEHVFVFSRTYLRSRLRNLGFNRVAFLPSPLLSRRSRLKHLYTGYYKAAAVLHALTFGTVTITPSVVVIARRSCGEQ